MAWASFVQELRDTMQRPLPVHQPDVDLGLARAAELVELIRAPGGADQYLLCDAVVTQILACCSGEGRQAISIGLLVGLQRAIREEAPLEHQPGASA